MGKARTASSVQASVTKERPIIFSASMVRAILEGRKTQTRRLFKVRDPIGESHSITSPDEEIVRFDDGTFHYASTAALSGPYPCPYGAPGNRLWVRETWADALPPMQGPVLYRADCMNGESSSWRPSIFMPRWASRITLEITDVRVQRLQKITANDVLAEGFIFSTRFELGTGYGLPNWSRGVEYDAAFRALWDSINAKRAPWDSNPWVWALTFRRVQP